MPADATISPATIQHGAAEKMPQRMPYRSEMLPSGLTKNSAPPSTRKIDTNENESDRTRAGDTKACTVSRGARKMPAVKLAVKPIRMKNHSVGLAASRISCTPTAASA